MIRTDLTIALLALALTAAVARAEPAPTAAAGNESFSVAAMVGQVSGRPVYADKVFEPIKDQLIARGKELPRDRFRLEAEDIIRRRVNAIVIEGLILAEAERNLAENERYGLLQMIKLERERLIRFFGKGAESLADANLRQTTGRGLEEKVNDYREEVIVRKYMQEKIIPQINVSRKDIERYYKRHSDEFNPPPGRTIHMIYTADKEKADKIDKMLVEGKSFLEIAADATLNSHRPDAQGLFPKSVKGEDQMIPALNEPMLKLGEGQYTQRIPVGSRFYWVFVKSISTGQAKPLRDVQADIERSLRGQQYTQLTRQYHEQLMANGSYDPIDDMVAALLDVAMTRFAIPGTK